MSKTLSDIRVEIDSIDNQVHDLLMQRASLVSSVASAKRKEGLQIVQPAREAMMMRRLLSRHHGVLPQTTIIRIWRELVGSVSLLQTGLTVVVACDDDRDFLWDIARNYFGSTVPMRTVQGNQHAISDVKTDSASFAVLPWPERDGTSPWWGHLFHHEQDEKLSVICALPYGQMSPDDVDLSARAVVVSKISFMPSEDDISFIGVEMDSDISRSSIMDAAQGVGLEVLNIYSGLSKDRARGKAYLLEVVGFCDAESPVLDGLKKALGKQCFYCDAIGGYPVVPDTRQKK